MEVLEWENILRKEKERATDIGVDNDLAIVAVYAVILDVFAE